MQLETMVRSAWHFCVQPGPDSGFSKRDDVLRRALVGAFFLILLLVGLGSYRDYGVFWDEPQQRTIGQVTLKYVAEKFAPSLIAGRGALPALSEFSDRDYGVGFEAPAVALEAVFKLQDKRDAYMFRHLLVFIVSFMGVYAVYRIAKRRFMDWRIGLLAMLFMVLTPRIFAESFYNSKDVVFMAAFAIASYTTISFVLNPGIRTALAHALATAFAIDVRIMAIALLAPTVLLPMIRVMRGELQLRRTGLALATYLCATCIFVVATWPYLWSDPAGNFVNAFRGMSHFRWPGKVLYMGVFIPGTAIPWHYALVWISITTPLLYLALFGLGFFATLRQIVARRFRLWSGDAELQDIIFVFLFAAPVAATIILHSVLYNGWRHLYFVYPAFLLLAVKGWVILWNAPSQHRFLRMVLSALTLVSATYTAAWMWNAHPLQNVYFNALAGHDVKSRFEMDYWGLGNRLSLEKILKSDPSPVIHVWSDKTNPLDHTFLILKPEERDRLKFTDDRSGPFYFVTAYRGVRQNEGLEYMQDRDLFYEVKRSGEAVSSIYKPEGGLHRRGGSMPVWGGKQ